MNSGTVATEPSASASPSRLRGVWAAIPVPWTVDDRIDTGMVVELIRRYAAAGVQGAYTAGTDGEMHVLDDADHRDLADALAAGHAETGLPVQAGCTGPHTAGVVARAEYAAAQGIPLVQVALPGWVTLSDAELLGYFADLSSAVPDTGLVHYNIAKAGRMLTGEHYRRIGEVAPNLVGSKHTGGGVPELIEVTQNSPGLQHFVVDLQILPGAMFGAAGFYSFLANLSPRFTAALWQACAARDWERAATLRADGERFLRAWRQIRPAIGSPALAKIATRAGVFAELPLGVRRPYEGGSEADVRAVRDLAAVHGLELG